MVVNAPAALATHVFTLPRLCLLLPASCPAGALKNLCCNSLPSKVAVVEAGIVPVVVQLLASPNGEVQRLAAGVLLNLSDAQSKRVQQACARAGAAAALLQLLSASGSTAEAQQDAAIALNQLAGRSAAQRRAIMAQPGSMHTLHQLLLSSTAAAASVRAALGTLRNLTYDDQAAAIMPLIPAVVQRLGRDHAGVVAEAAALLGDLARYDAGARQAIMAAGGVPAFAAAARRSPAMSTTETAATIALTLVGNRQAATAAVHALGASPGEPHGRALLESFVAGEIPPEAASMRPQLHVPGTAPMCFLMQASGYRWVGAMLMPRCEASHGLHPLLTCPCAWQSHACRPWRFTIYTVSGGSKNLATPACTQGRPA